MDQSLSRFSFLQFKSKSHLVFTLMLITSICAVYFEVMKYPFIQDDWCVVKTFMRHQDSDVLQGIFSPIHKIFYRPLGQLYFFIMFKIFSAYLPAYHVVALLLHFCSSLLIVAIVHQIMNDMLISWATGFLYAAAVSIHMDTLLWVVGIYDIGGAFLFFLSLYLFIIGRVNTSAIIFTVGLFVKESLVILPFILFLYIIFNRKERATFFDLKQNTVVLLPFVLSMTTYMMIRALGLMGERFLDTERYAIQMGMTSLFENLQLFSSWSFQAITPLTYLQKASSYMLIALILMIAFVFMRMKNERRKIVMLSSWFFACLLPVIFFSHHAYRYYLVYSLPAYLVVLLLVMKELVILSRMPERLIKYIMTTLCTVQISSSAFWFYQLDKKGYGVQAIEGSGNLIRKGAAVSIAKEALLKEIPVPPKGSIFIFDPLPIVSFCGDVGPQFWYQDSSIHVYEMLQVNIDSVGIYPVEKFQDGQVIKIADQERKYVDLQKSFLFIYYEDRLQRWPLPSLRK